MNTLIKACKAGDFECVKDLFSKKICSEYSCVVWASITGHLELVKYLVSRCVNISNSCRTNIILFISGGKEVTPYGQLEVIKYLVSQGANVRDNEDEPIKLASRYGRLDLVKYFVSQGATINECLVQASIGGHLDVIKYLISQGANVTDYSHAIHCASWNDHFDVVKYLAEQGAETSYIDMKSRKYLYFCYKMKEKIRIRAQKKIYFWWIPICYDVKRECGKRMAQHNFNTYKKMIEM